MELLGAGGSSTGYEKSDCVEVNEKMTLLFLYLSKQYINKLLVSIASFKGFSVEHYACFLMAPFGVK